MRSLLSRIRVNNWSILPIQCLILLPGNLPASLGPSLTNHKIICHSLAVRKLQRNINETPNCSRIVSLSKNNLLASWIDNTSMEGPKGVIDNQVDSSVKSPLQANNDQYEIQNENEVDQETDVGSKKTREILLQQEKDLFEYRKQQRKRWKKSQSNDKLPEPLPGTSEDIGQTEEKEEKSKQGRKNYISNVGTSPRKKHREKRRHKSSESDKIDNKRRSYETKQTVRDVDSPVFIDLDPVCISEPTASSSGRSGDIIRVEDMDLATTDEEDIVMLMPQPQPGTSRDGQKDEVDKDDDVLYMGTVINLTESPTSITPRSLVPTSRDDANSENLPACSYNPSSMTSLSRQQQPYVPYTPSNSRYMFNSSSSSVSYSTASGSFNTYSSSFSSFMSAAAQGNAVRPSARPGPPTVLPSGRASWGAPWSHHSAAAGQPRAQLHQSTAVHHRGSSHNDHYTKSFSKRDKTYKSKTKKSKLRNRSWVSVGATPMTSNNVVGVTVASYNLLAQNLLENNMYLYEDGEYLDWGYRSANLLEEIHDYSPDVLCLQEVKHDHYSKFFKPRLESLGYSGCYKKRTGDMEDGCATFFKDNKFELDLVRPLEYYTPGASVLDRDNVALLVRLIPRDKPTDTKLVVANTHLLFNPKRGDVKLAQLVLLLAELDRLAHVDDPGVSPFSPAYHPTVLMGDFNSEPRSLLYQFLQTGRVDYLGQRISSFSGQEEGIRSQGYSNFGREIIPKSLKITDSCQHKEQVQSRCQRWEEATKGQVPQRSDSPKDSSENNKDLPHAELLRQCTGSLQTFLPLVSVYKHWSFSPHSRRREREVTTHHARSRCTVDYIFYAAGTRVGWKKGEVSEPETQLQLVKRLELLTDSEMEQLGPLPNREVSSDHTLLAAKFKLKL